LRYIQVLVYLQPQPELGRHAEVAGEAVRSVGRDAAFAVDDFVDAAGRHTDGEGEVPYIYSAF
jgi:hypothetical protein